MSPWDDIRLACPLLYRNGIMFECGIGWHDIILQLSLKIEQILQEYAEKQQVPEGEEYQIIEMFAVQVKEKYGTLRFYMSCETDTICDLIEDAEALSSQTCEGCGAPGKMRGKRWFEVKCEACFSGGK